MRQILAALLAVVLNLSFALADTLESLVMPGKVIAGHAQIEGQCRKCHEPFKKENQNALCLDCHKETAKDVVSHSGFHGRHADKPCRDCHAEHLGRDARIVILDERRFDHRLTDYVLFGKHETAKCAACHIAGKKHREAAHECVGCHQQNDTHKGTLGSDCAHCHVESDWKKTSFDHSKTRFALRGRHVQTRCSACHKNANLSQTPRDCVGCHRKDDIHAGKFGNQCNDCHGERDWKKMAFDHGTTRFPLAGKHARIRCADCHVEAGFKGVPLECVACHRKDDIHREALGKNCADCHVDRSWKETRFDHGKTKFPLLGAHGKVRCLACHKSQSFNDAPAATCVACHRKNDVHKGGFGDKCETCHVEGAWKELKFDHDRDTRFKLRDAHRRIKCQTCHVKPLYAEKTAQECSSCHAKKDVHRGRLGTRCESCHTEVNWKATTFDHARDTKYPLRGRHAAIACKSCHVDGTFERKLTSQCMDCHRKDDKHAGQQSPDCGSCHEEGSWKKTGFDHAKSRFALTGQHLTVKCNACHLSLRFKDARKECVACHAKQDVHKRRLGENCESCHNTRDWSIWDFDHDKRTAFALDGAHKKAACVACHTRAGDKIEKIGARCIDCHERDDVHRESFGKNCERCHTTANFKEIRR